MKCRDHEEAMLLLAGGGYVCLSCERGDPPIGYRPRPMSSEYEDRDEFEEALTDWKKQYYPPRKGREF